MGTTPQRQQGPRAHPSAMKRMSMPVMPVSRPVPGPGGAGAPQGRPVRPGLGHGRMPSMQAPGAPRVLSGPARPPFRTLSGAQHARSPTMVRSPVMPSSPTGAMRGAAPSARPMPGTHVARPQAMRSISHGPRPPPKNPMVEATAGTTAPAQAPASTTASAPATISRSRPAAVGSATSRRCHSTPS